MDRGRYSQLAYRLPDDYRCDWRFRNLARAARANCIAPAVVYGEQDAPPGVYQWVNPTDYAPPPAGTFLTCGVSTVHAPGLPTRTIGTTLGLRQGSQGSRNVQIALKSTASERMRIEAAGRPHLRGPTAGSIFLRARFCVRYSHGPPHLSSTRSRTGVARL
jgi:hypothetical protein